MLLRCVGIVFSLIGLAMGIFAAWGLSRVDFMAGNTVVAASGFSPAEWAEHWKLWSGLLMCSGLATVVGGTAAAFSRRWGLLVLSAVSVFLAILPWILQALHSTRYQFEAPDLSETGICVGIAIANGLIYIFSRERDAFDAS